MYKHGSCDDPSNDRPITVVTIIAKIPAVVSQLNSYCEDVQLMGPYQGTHCNGRSTEQILLFAVVTIVNALDHHYCVYCLP